MKINFFLLKNKILFANSILIFFYFILIIILIQHKNEGDNIVGFQRKIYELNSFIGSDLDAINLFMLNDNINADLYKYNITKNIITHNKFVKKTDVLSSEIKQNIYYSGNYKVKIDFLVSLQENRTYVFNSLLQFQIKRGFSDYGYEGNMRNSIHFVENNDLLPLYKTLMFRRHEKDYIIRKNYEYIHKLEELYNKTIKQLNSKTQVYSKLYDYNKWFMQIVKLDSNISIEKNRLNYYDEKIKKTITDINSLIESTNQKIKKENTYIILKLAISFILISIILNWIIAHHISKKLHNLNIAIKDFIANDYLIPSKFNYEIKHDEIGEIITNFFKLESQIIGYINNFNVQLSQRTKEIELQKLVLQNQNKTIFDSIKYAESVQKSFLPKNEHLKKVFSSVFMVYIPRDILSGDFIWTKTIQTRTKNLSFAILGDCTGHGIPGAMISMVAITSINEIILHKQKYSTDTILNKLNNKFIELFQEESNQSIMYEGVDIGVILVDNNENKLEYAGANIDLLLMRKGNVEVISGNKISVGRTNNIDFKFTKTSINIQKNDMLYLFSDGFQDQFGGELNKKYKRKNLHNFLKSIHNKDVEVQKNEIETEFQKWKGDYFQVDDISVLGIKI